MVEPHSDPKSVKAAQRRQWSDVAEGWRKQWATFERGAQTLSDRMMDLAEVEPGQRVLDVATGIGEPAMTAAHLVGPHGSVLAIDQAPDMLEVARERMQAAGISTVELVEADAEAVTLPPDSFDAVVCRWGLNLFHDPVGTLARLRSSLVPGGWLVAAIWGPPERVPLISLAFAARQSQAEQLASPPPGPNPFALSEPARLEQVLRDAGLAEVRSEPFTVTLTFASVDEFLEYLADVSAPVRMMTATSSREHLAGFWDHLAAAAAAFTAADGTLRLANECLIVWGQRSS